MNTTTYRNITFRPLQEADLPLLWRWLQQPHVAQWYTSGSTFDEIKTKYLAYINESKPTHAFVAMLDGTDIGYLQCYRLDDYPDYKKIIAIEDNACGIDMFIGNKAYIHQGIGPLMIIKFLDTLAFPLTNADSCYLSPDPKNEAAKKAYVKVGFTYIKTIVNDGKDEYIMRATPAAIAAKAKELVEKRHGT
jgi:RimJ/RimL family protein N-acetyltransferase